jgi:cyclopropane fatty-acyl-phospholipid synthase-like methyltransferase
MWEYQDQDTKYLLNDKMTVFFKIKRILEAYTKASLATKIHICLRWLTCPMEIILQFTPKAASFLEIGCGHGLFSYLVSDAKKADVVHGVDISQKKIAVAGLVEKKGVREFFCKDIKKLPAKKYDVIALIDVLYLVPKEEWPEFFNIIYGLLNKSGVFILKEVVLVPYWKYIWLFIQEYLSMHLFCITTGSAFAVGSEEELYEHLVTAGFREIVVHHIDKGYAYPHIAFTMKKA